jgi:hypothetical protein
VIVAGSSISSDPKYGYSSSDGALARYRLDNGPADADADGILDSSDRCPNVFEPRESDGCPPLSRTLTLEVRRGRRYARLEATLGAPDRRCGEGAEVVVHRVRHGEVKDFPAEWIAGHGKRRFFEVKVRRRHQWGRFYATADENLVPTLGKCLAAESNSVRLRQR